MPFAIAMIWRKSEDHLTECYFSLTDTERITFKTKYKVKYTNFSNAMRTFLHSGEVPVSVYPDMILSGKSDSNLYHTRKYQTVLEVIQHTKQVVDQNLL